MMDTYAIMKGNSMKASVSEIIGRTFPNGTNPSSGSNDHQIDLNVAPTWPPDVFGAAGMLLERSGLYQLLSPGRLHRWEDPWFTIRDEDARDWHAAAQEWRSKFAVPALVQEMWSELAASTVPFNSFPGSGHSVPRWVRAAVGLFITADEASAGIGYVRLDADPSSLSWIDMFDAKTESAWIKRNTDNPKSTAGHVLITTHRYSVGLMIAQDMVAVQPKARTPQVGASLRTMSQHLSLLPPPSRIGATWQRIANTGDDAKSDLNLLLVPYPYKVEEEWFSGVREGGSSGSEWGWFDLTQSWLPADPAVFTEFVTALIEHAEQEDADMKIDGIILPEYALTWDHHEHLVEHLANSHDEIEFVVSGSRTNCEQAEGNFALTSSINRSQSGKPIIQTNSRGKHHRWRLDKPQIETYELQERLDTKLKWWEGIALHRRQVHTHVLRNASSFTTFICEDLARSDPCHETVRALGPNIVFCLLMDNVQIPIRWPGRYAAILAEDPGSSVLTFTSRGLIARAVEREKRCENGRGRAQRAAGTGYARAANWSVGLWRDNEKTCELHCPPGDHAVVLRLRNQPVQDASYDDRVDRDGMVWVHEQSYAVRLKDNDSRLVALERSDRMNSSDRYGTASEPLDKQTG